MSLPVFDGGRRAAGVQNANAQRDIAAAAYREQVLGAARDVEDQLSSLRLLSDQASAQELAVDAATHATALSDTRYRNGLVSQLELLDAGRTELAVSPCRGASARGAVRRDDRPDPRAGWRLGSRGSDSGERTDGACFQGQLIVPCARTPGRGRPPHPDCRARSSSALCVDFSCNRSVTQYTLRT